MDKKICKKILLVINNSSTLKQIDGFLTSEGHQVIGVQDEFAFLDSLVEFVPDIIFLDHIMPRIGGEDLCHIIRNVDHLNDCHVVFFSDVTMEVGIDLKKLGADACIAKGSFQNMQCHILKAVANSDNDRESEFLPEIQGGRELHSRQVTRDLLKQNYHIKVILEEMSQGIIEIDRNRIVYLNPQAALILGKPKGKILGMEMRDVFPEPLLTAISKDQVDNDMMTGLLMKTTPIQFGSKQISFEQFSIRESNDNNIIILSDITERRRLESVIEAANLTENIGYVFSGIRHEIGNPVNSIKIALSVLQKNLQEYDKETIADFLDRSLVEVSRIEYLLKALKNYSLFEKPFLYEFSCNVFMDELLKLVKEDCKERDIHIQCILPDEEITIFADSRALHHIMLNLLTNSMDAFEDVSNPIIIIRVSKRNAWVEITVDDNGCGIDSAEQDTLFKPFFTSKVTGTGLGLVIVKKMLTAMNGQIRIESYKDVGTKVTLTIPGAEECIEK